jgi:AraC-like DNA-binding protein
MIFHFGDLYRQYIDDGNRIIQPKSFVFGQLSRPLEIEPTGETSIFSVRFHPDGFLPFSTIPIREMENTAVSLLKLFGEQGQEIETKMSEAGATAERIKLIEAFLFSRLTDNRYVDNIIKSVVETIVTANGQLSIDELSKQSRINRRKLERKFSSAIGLSPKQLSKTIRLQATLKMLLSKRFTSLTALAYESEYYDQAHFIKDFKEMTGFTPKDFYGDTLKMSAFFYGSD